MTLQGSNALSSKMAVVPQHVKVLALSGVKPCLDAVIDLMKCFPHLEKLYIKVTPTLLTCGQECLHLQISFATYHALLYIDRSSKTFVCLLCLFR
jgi:hypothetical protein